MFTKLPDASILCVPPVAPVLIPVVPLRVVPVIVFAVDTLNYETPIYPLS